MSLREKIAHKINDQFTRKALKGGWKNSSVGEVAEASIDAADAIIANMSPAQRNAEDLAEALRQIKREFSNVRGGHRAEVIASRALAKLEKDT